MTLRLDTRAMMALMLGGMAVTPARALIALNDGRDRVHLNAAVSFAQDSNIFANSDDAGDSVISTEFRAEYTRRAGWIGVNANAAVASSRFDAHGEQNFDNPSFGLEFTKQTGRTTGSLTLNAARESRADADVNTRSTSWSIPVGLNFKYPIVSTYTLAGSFGYSQRDYADETVFASLTSTSAALDLLHMISTERDVLLGYRYRTSQTSRETASTDHGVSAGLSGKLIRGFMGHLRVGYQTRTPERIPGEAARFDTWTASGTASYALNKRTNLNATLAKDFATTATDASVDTSTATLDAHYAYSSRWTASAAASAGATRFLGQGGRVLLDAGPPPAFGRQRRDHHVSATGTANYSLNEHFKASLTYAWFRNWSTIAYADFIRSSWTLTVSTRW